MIGNCNHVLGSIFLCLSLVSVLYAGGGEARFIRSPIIVQRNEAETIPAFLLRMYAEMGREKFESTWKAFNNRNPDQQDAFLMEDLSDEDLAQLGNDFEKLAMALSADPNLMELYADFEHNLSIVSFMEMDNKLQGNRRHQWWIRIKKFLSRKLQKLAQEMILQEGEQASTGDIKML